MDTISRKEAVELGLTHYFTQIPCKHGHISKRFTKNCECVECANIRVCSENGKVAREKYQNSEKGRTASKKYRESEKGKSAITQRIKRKGNGEDPVKHRLRSLKWKNNNIERWRELGRIHCAKRSKNPSYKIAHSMRSRLSEVVRSDCKSPAVEECIGCSIEFLKSWLEEAFTDQMSWDNYGPMGWHIDHIYPCSSFDLTNSDQLKKCFHYTNLQPLMWYDNVAKGARIPQ